MGYTHRGEPTGNNHVPTSRNERYGFSRVKPYKIPNYRTGSPYFDDYSDDAPYYNRYMRNYFPFRRYDYEM